MIRTADIKMLIWSPFVLFPLALRSILGGTGLEILFPRLILLPPRLYKGVIRASDIQMLKWNPFVLFPLALRSLFGGTDVEILFPQPF